MSDLDRQFEQAFEDIKTLTERPDNETMLQLYSYYKQGSEGDVQGEKPGFFDFVGVAKYEAWEKLKGMDPQEAKQNYIGLVEELKNK